MKRILIIDDDPDIRTVMNILLKKQGFEVDSASRREEVFEKVQAFNPSIILLDVLLSGSDGRDICRELKADDATKAIPVIMFSAHPGAADNIDSYGANDFISKPLNVDALLEKVNNQLQGKYE
jgi:DNA-binding response OmpR family regulator